MEAIAEAHLLADVAERAYRQGELEAATGFGRSAWRRVEFDPRRGAVEAFVKASRTESWSWHHLDVLDRAELAAARAVGHARLLAPKTPLLAWSQIRQLEVWGIDGKVDSCLAGCRWLADELESESWGRELAFIASYGALGAAVKLREWDAARQAERRAKRLLAQLGDSRYERVFWNTQALYGMHSGRTDDAHEHLVHARVVSDRPGEGDLFTLAHVHFLDHQRQTGEDFLREAILRAHAKRHHQSVRAALGYMAPFVSGEIRQFAESVDAQRPGEIVIKLNLN